MTSLKDHLEDQLNTATALLDEALRLNKGAHVFSCGTESTIQLCLNALLAKQAILDNYLRATTDGPLPS